MFDFRGFYGSYEVAINIDGQSYLGYFDAAKGEDGILTVTVYEHN
jgi:alkyl sulfatase BDS1-like metallo-beta-lactamase superfamily hydrolase